MRKEKIIYIGLAVVIAVMLLLDGGFSFSSKKASLVFNLSDLNLTQIDLPCEVYITKGNNDKLVVEGPEDVLDKLSINNENGILSITGHDSDGGILGFAAGKLNLSEKVKVYINHSQLDRIIVNNSEARIISVDYKPMHYQANSCQDSDPQEEHVGVFKFTRLAGLKQQFVKSLIESTIFRLYATV